MTFTEKLSYLISKNGLNRRRFSEDSGVSYSTIDNWYKRSYEGMTVGTLRTLCSYFGVTMDSMAYDDREIEYVRDREMSFSSDDAAMIRQYRDLDSTQQAMIRASLDAAHADSKGDAAPASAS